MFWRRHLARIDAVLADNRAFMERGFAEFRQFSREERLRANKVLEPLIASHNKLIASHDDLVAETRAQREALFRMLDELRGDEPGEAPA